MTKMNDGTDSTGGDVSVRPIPPRGGEHGVGGYYATCIRGKSVG
jgi:hypothetical protein